MNDIPWKLYLFGFVVFSQLFVMYVKKLKAGEFARRAPNRSVLIRLYWQRPMASMQANKVLYWFCMIPFLIFCLFFVISFSIAPEHGKTIHVEMVLGYLYAFGAINLIRGPDGFVVGPGGLFWLQEYSWEEISNQNWKSDKTGEFFCFTLPTKNNEYPQETRIGPLSSADKERINTVLELIPKPDSEQPA